MMRQMHKYETAQRENMNNMSAKQKRHLQHEQAPSPGLKSPPERMETEFPTLGSYLRRAYPMKSILNTTSAPKYRQNSDAIAMVQKASELLLVSGQDGTIPSYTSGVFPNQIKLLFNHGVEAPFQNAYRPLHSTARRLPSMNSATGAMLMSPQYRWTLHRGSTPTDFAKTCCCFLQQFRCAPVEFVSPNLNECPQSCESSLVILQ